MRSMHSLFSDIPTPIAVVGGGLSGQAALKLLRAAGFPDEQVILFDAKEGKGQYSDASQMMMEVAPKTLVVSPGVWLKTPWIQKAKSEGIHITSELSLACRVLQKEQVIAVTGSLGKSTTVSLLGEGAKVEDANAFIGGNLGVPFAEYAAGVLSGSRQRAKLVVLELSSYQLENCEGLKPELSVLTYFCSNHLERYDSLQEYYETKWRLVELTTKACVFNENGGDLAAFAKAKTPNGQSATQWLWTSAKRSLLGFEQLKSAQLIGAHNKDNLAVAAAAAKALGWREFSVDAMLKFPGLPHRLENLGTHSQIQWINDSKATAMESVLTAAKSVHETLLSTSQMWLLLGGRDKKLPWEQLQELSKLERCSFVFFGECATLAKAKSTLTGGVAVSLRDAVSIIRSKAKAGDIVLLSPGGTSLDEFKNFEDRGTSFAQMAKGTHSS